MELTKEERRNATQHGLLGQNITDALDEMKEQGMIQEWERRREKGHTKVYVRDTTGEVHRVGWTATAVVAREWSHVRPSWISFGNLCQRAGLQ